MLGCDIMAHPGNGNEIGQQLLQRLATESTAQVLKAQQVQRVVELLLRCCGSFWPNVTCQVCLATGDGGNQEAGSLCAADEALLPLSGAGVLRLAPRSKVHGAALEAFSLVARAAGAQLRHLEEKRGLEQEVCRLNRDLRAYRMSLEPLPALLTSQPKRVSPKATSPGPMLFFEVICPQPDEQAIEALRSCFNELISEAAMVASFAAEGTFVAFERQASVELAALASIQMAAEMVKCTEAPQLQGVKLSVGLDSVASGKKEAVRHSARLPGKICATEDLMSCVRSAQVDLRFQRVVVDGQKLVVLDATDVLYARLSE